nr:PREDICTED: uncharacterized protein LOC103989958 [Musa acuminata subsp. malaccensis]XP_018683492.1 PREDICTED: uncharacterized protein LOC103989958 [Musa acuminata subsp. malaccensis]
MLLAGCDATFLYTGIFFNTTLNSALTQTMCGKLKDLFTIGLGWLLFGGLPFDVLSVTGQILGFVGSGFYAYCKIKGKYNFIQLSQIYDRISHRWGPGFHSYLTCEMELALGGASSPPGMNFLWMLHTPLDDPYACM